MKKPKLDQVKIEYEAILKQYGFHKYSAQRLSCKLTIVCKSIEELVIAQALGSEREWIGSKRYHLDVIMPNYRKYLESFNPDIEEPIFPIYVSFKSGVFKREINLDRTEPVGRRIVQFSKFFTLKPEYRGNK
jgi:hypothetical protein